MKNNHWRVLFLAVNVRTLMTVMICIWMFALSAVSWFRVSYVTISLTISLRIYPVSSLPLLVLFSLGLSGGRALVFTCQRGSATLNSSLDLQQEHSVHWTVNSEGDVTEERDELSFLPQIWRICGSTGRIPFPGTVIVLRLV